MRITGGNARGIPIVVPGGGTRPTMDAVRQALFSSLGEAVLDMNVLDLFAGSGALGMEALSRGAASATLVEQNKAACAVIHRNLEKARLQARVICQPVTRYLRDAARGSGRFGLILADPPYSKEIPAGGEKPAETLLADVALPDLLEDGGTFVLESGAALEIPNPWHLLRMRKYGSTCVHFLCKATA